MKQLSLFIDGQPVAVEGGTTILQAAECAGISIPHLCACDREGYRPIASCRMCLVEVEGETALTPACRRPVEPNMMVATNSGRVVAVRQLVAELTAADMSEDAFERQQSKPFGTVLRQIGVTQTRFSHRQSSSITDSRHPAIAVDEDACIHCGLCRVACQDVQINGVIALAGHSDHTHVAFDFGRPLVDSSCVSCGECVQVCPTGALAPRAPTTGDVPVQVEHVAQTVCPFCSVGCRVELAIAQNRVCGTRGGNGPANRGRLCVKGRFGFDYLSHPDRLTVPLIRRDDRPKDATAHLMAAEVRAQFREASWEEALDRAAAGFLSVKRQYGAEALAVLGSAKGSNEDAYLLQKLARSVFGSNHVDHCTRLCASVPPLAEAIGYSAVTAPIANVFDADVILMVGSNPEVNHPVAATFMKNAIRRGTKMILVDPYRQPFARHATFHLQLRPGTDVVLLSAMTNVVISGGLYDREFVKNRVDGFDELAKRVSQYSPDIASRVCGIPSDAIVAAARLFAHAPAAMCFWGMGASQHIHGADNIRSVIALALICGQVGRRGTGLHPLRGQNNVQGSCDAGLMPMALPGYRRLGDDNELRDFEALWKADLSAAPGLTVVEIFDAMLDGRMKALYVVGGNPAMANPDLAATRRALASLDHLVVQDIFPTETAAFADVILPAAALAERRGTVTNTDRCVQMLEPALAPPGQARADWSIVCEIARRMGADWTHDNVADVFAEMASAVPLLAGFEWTQLSAARSLQYPLGLAETEDSLFATTFPRPGGRARIASVSFGAPAELPSAAYPLVLVTGRVREHWHTGSMTRRSSALDALSPEPAVHVAPSDFEGLGLRRGGSEAASWVDVETERGRVRVKAISDERLQNGVIWMAMSFFEAAANELTARHLDPTTRVPAYKYCAARIRPVGHNR